MPIANYASCSNCGALHVCRFAPSYTGCGSGGIRLRFDHDNHINYDEFTEQLRKVFGLYCANYFNKELNRRRPCED